MSKVQRIDLSAIFARVKILLDAGHNEKVVFDSLREVVEDKLYQKGTTVRKDAIKLNLDTFDRCNHIRLEYEQWRTYDHQ